MPQLFDILFNDFRSARGKVNRILGAGLLFALIAHFYVVEPYFEYKRQETRLKEILFEKRKQINLLSERSERMVNLSENIKRNQKNIEDEVKHFPQHLRGRLSDIRKLFHPESSSNSSEQVTHIQQSAVIQQSGDIRELKYKKIGDVSLPSDITTFNDGVDWYIKTWFDDLLEDIKKRIEEPIKQTDIKSGMVGDIELLNITQQGTKDIQGYIDGVIKENPDFWKTYSGTGGKVDVAQGLQSEVKKSFNPLWENITTLVEGLKNAEKVQRGELINVKGDMAKLEGRKVELDQWLSSLESPFGRIPADLTDFIKLFPVLMVGLIVFVTASIRKSMSLYTALWEEYKKNDPEADVTVFQRQTDCWYLPPYPNMFRLFILGCCIAIIVCVFVRSSLLVVSGHALFKPLISDEVDFLSRDIFIGVYIFGVLVIIGCLYFNGKILRGRKASHLDL